MKPVIAALAALIMTAAPALAWPDALEGRPPLNHESPVGYYVWHDEDGLHLRTHGPGDEHQFVARLRTDGTFVDVDAVRLESRDRVRISDGGHVLVFDVHTFDWTDGTNFHVRGGERLRLDLELDGEPIATESIYLGADGEHPATNPFIIRR
jgi:hypothetical protein